LIACNTWRYIRYKTYVPGPRGGRVTDTADNPAVMFHRIDSLGPASSGKGKAIKIPLGRDFGSYMYHA